MRNQERHRPAGATFTRSKATARGREDGGRHRPEGTTITRSKATARCQEDGGRDKIGQRGQPLQDRKPLPGAEKTEGYN